MSVIQAVLDFEPYMWEKKPPGSYNNSYLLFNVPTNGTEWRLAIEDFQSYEDLIDSIQRVQNPFQWGLFKIQGERRSSEYSSVSKITGYHVIHTADLNTALKYPLDYRRYSHRNSTIQSNDKNPRFYTSFDTALANARHSSLMDSNGEIIIIKCEYFDSPKNQGDYNPKYVIRLTP